MQYPSIAGQPESCTADQTSEDSKEDDASTQVTKRQYPDVGVKYETFIVDQTSNNDSKGNDFSTQMNKLPAFSDSLYDSSDDGSEGLSTSNSEVASQRPRRGCSNPIPMNNLGYDFSSSDSEDEYIPKPEEWTDSDCSIELSLENDKTKIIASTNKSKCKPSSQNQLKSSSPTSSQSRSFETSHDPQLKFRARRHDANKELSVSMHHQNKASVFVSPVMKKQNGSKRYNKKHHCLFCEQVVQKMSRHLWRQHSDKVDVAKAFSFPQNSKESKLQLDYIRNKGNFSQNTEVLAREKGKLISSKQPKEKKEGHVFAHCVYCYGLFTKRVMWRHFKIFKFKPQDQKSKPGKTRVQALCAFAEPAPAGLSGTYWKFLSGMNQDKIAIAIKGDHCILEYGYRLFKKNVRVTSQYQHIRQKLRELGRLLLAAKEVTPVKTVKELKCMVMVTAPRRVAGFSDTTGR
ncbi:uncharacterized protein LOC133483175 isoform X1 [Phyllopteryx taeniolatus]|uniref:uncharacterized protein LOC133483175 isoform X1 n=1 Tax=Phyllopteryx taeniolatus TaxID=161469 RepID=UPI002AD511CE|nr:uncharacterized protein LOC133483175 isoform X1 [Phyllopteryx taeniolatus]